MPGILLGTIDIPVNQTRYLPRRYLHTSGGGTINILNKLYRALEFDKYYRKVKKRSKI